MLLLSTAAASHVPAWTEVVRRGPWQAPSTPSQDHHDAEDVVSTWSDWSSDSSASLEDFACCDATDTNICANAEDDTWSCASVPVKKCFATDRPELTRSHTHQVHTHHQLAVVKQHASSRDPLWSCTCDQPNVACAHDTWSKHSNQRREDESPVKACDEDDGIDGDFLDWCDAAETLVRKQSKAGHLFHGCPKTGHKQLRKAIPLARRRGNASKLPTKRKLTQAIRVTMARAAARIEASHTPPPDFTEEVYDLDLAAIEQRIRTDPYKLASQKVEKVVKATKPKVCPILRARALKKVKREQHAVRFDLKKMQPVPEESFCGAQFKKLSRTSAHYCLVWHGTTPEAVPSILARGLLPGGSRGVPRRHGAAYGHGVYVGKEFGASAHYSKGTFILCALFSSKALYTNYYDFMVVKSHGCLVPVMVGSSTKVRVPGSKPWREILSSAADQGRGRLCELELLVDANRMSLGGRHCHTSAVLRAYGLSKQVKKMTSTRDDESCLF
jgi:hypothetical protein